MSTAMTTKADLLTTIARERASWEALLAEIGESRMTEPGATGDWSFKDVVGHLSGWRERTLARLEAAGRDDGFPPSPWPAEFDAETDAGLEAINAWIYARNQDRPLAEVLAESRAQFDALTSVVSALPETALFNRDLAPWTNGEPIGPAVLDGTFAHFHEEHEPTLRAWLAGDDRPG